MKRTAYQAGVAKRRRAEVKKARLTGLYLDRMATGRLNPYSGYRQYSRALANPETKYFDCGFNAGISTAGTTWADTEVPMDNYITSAGAVGAYTDSCLIPSATGSGYGQVIGNAYKIKKIRVRGQCTIATLPDQPDVNQAAGVRILLVRDTQPNGAQAQGETIMQDMGALQENTFTFKAVTDTASRFKILKDKFIVLDVAAVGTDGASTMSVGFKGRQFKFTYQPRKPIQVRIKSNNATPTIAGQINENIFMLAYAYTGASTATLVMTGCSRCYYCE